MLNMFFLFMREVGMPILLVGMWALIATFASKRLVKAWKEDDTKKIWECIWGLSICLLAVLRGAPI